MSITLTDDQFAALLAGANPSLPQVAAPVATADNDAALRGLYATYKARVTRGKPRTFAQWVADEYPQGLKPGHAAPAPAAPAAPVDPDIEAAGRMLKRDGCAAVVRFPDGSLGGIYTYRSKAGTGRASVLADDPDGATLRYLLAELAGLVIATR